jgi:hypothetical protein
MIRSVGSHGTESRRKGRYTLVVQFVGLAKQPQLPLPDGFLEGELVPSQHGGVVEQQQ